MNCELNINLEEPGLPMVTLFSVELHLVLLPCIGSE